MAKLIKIAGDGRKVEAEAGEYLNAAELRITIGGAKLATVNASNIMLAKDAPSDIRNRLPADCHGVIITRTTTVTLAAEQYALVTDILTAKQTEIDASPDAIERKLRAERRDLYLGRASILDKTTAAREGMVMDRYDNADYLDATAKIEAWESAHPELMATLAAEKAESLKVHQWD